MFGGAGVSFGGPGVTFGGTGVLFGVAGVLFGGGGVLFGGAAVADTRRKNAKGMRKHLLTINAVLNTYTLSVLAFLHPFNRYI